MSDGKDVIFFLLKCSMFYDFRRGTALWHVYIYKDQELKKKKVLF